MLLRLFEMPHLDNLRILKALIYNKDDILPLLDGTSKTRVLFYFTNSPFSNLPNALSFLY